MKTMSGTPEKTRVVSASSEDKHDHTIHNIPTKDVRYKNESISPEPEISPISEVVINVMIILAMK